MHTADVAYRLYPKPGLKKHISYPDQLLLHPWQNTFDNQRNSVKNLPSNRMAELGLTYSRKTGEEKKKLKYSHMSQW